jgi:serine/threonine-protein kinase
VSRAHRYPKDVPRELAALCQRAMAADPADRFADAQEMRRALARHLEHRTSLALAAEAAARLDRLLALGPGERAAARSLYTECRFGFEQALRAWEGNAEAKAGLERAVVAMVELELAAGDPRAAADHAAALAAPHPELQAKVEALAARLAADAAERARVEALGRDLDADAFARPRRLFVAALGMLGAAMMFVAYVVAPTAETRAARLGYGIWLPVAWIVGAGAASWLGKRAVFPTRASRIIVGGVLAGGVAVLLNRVLTLLVRGGSLPDAIAGDLTILAVVAAMITLCADRRFALPAVLFLACAVLAIALPAHAVLLLGISLLGFAASSAHAALREDQGGGPLVQ